MSNTDYTDYTDYAIKIPFEPSLFLHKKHIVNSNQRVVIIGDFFEEATAKLFNYERICLNSEYDCIPDLMNRETKVYIESKAGVKGFAIRKDQFKLFVDNFPELYFCLWYYNPREYPSTKPEKIQQVLAHSVVTLYTLHITCMQQLMEGATGVNAKRLNIKTVDQYVTGIRTSVDVVDDLEVYGHRTIPFTRITSLN